MKSLTNHIFGSFNVVLFFPGLIAFITYFLTLAPTLQVADAGEQITAAHFLGVSHPTGTPLYLLVMKGWESIIPFGTIAWRMNLLNALLGSVGVAIFSGLIFRVSLSLGASKGRSLMTALIFSMALAYSQTYWYESVAASSYSLHYLFVISWFFLVSHVILQKSYGLLYCLYLITGLALANHILSLVLLVLTLWYSVSLCLRKEISFKRLAGLQPFLLPGLLFYLYIPMRAASKPILNWGNPDSLDRLLHYLLRKDYYGNVYVSNIEDLLGVVLFHLKSFLSEMSPLLPLILALLVLLHAWRWFKDKGGQHSGSAPPALKSRRQPGLTAQLIVVGMAVFFLNLFLLSLHGSHLDLFFLKRYMVMGYIGLFFSSAVFVVAGLQLFGKKIHNTLSALLVLLPVVCLASHFEENDRSKNTLLRSYVDQLFSHLPKGATFYAIGDNHFFPVLYYHLVEGVRPDLTLFNPEMGMGNKAQVPRLLSEGGFYSSHYLKTDGPITLRPMGLVFKATEGDGRKQEVAWREFSQEEIRKARAPLE
ncbi:MAG: DUF2723 domain-containing protein [Desulfobacterales bacterium]|nr:DUF2723 domain-containing protein [Desulfobacterales bacterium]